MVLSDLTEQQRLEFLSEMCLYNNPIFFVGGVIKRWRSEYVPRNEKDIELAQKLFQYSGVNMKVEQTWVNPYVKQTVLSCKSLFYNNRNFQRVVGFMTQIEETSQKLVKSGDEWYRIQKSLNEIRKEQNQK